MDKIKHISLSQLGLYNPQRLDDEAVQSLFVVRQKYFQLLIDKISKENPNSIPQHYLFIGQRGMGKSTLLKRIEVELRKDNSNFVPLLFPEEQYNLNNLSEFWLNSLDALADVLELLKMKEEVRLIDSKVKELQKIKNVEDLAKQAFQFLIEMSKKIGKRPVLLIDNMSFIFDRLDKSEQHTLRAWLMQNDAPILIGASAVEIEDTYNYGAPFYDAFQISYLNKLSFEELLDILNNLAKVTNAEEILVNIHDEIARLKTIHQLTGGNPRTAVMLFKIIVKGFSKEINDDLEALLDEITPLYKARFEELSVQMQIIVDAIALHWDPMNLEQLRTETRLENNQLSPQLKRLVEIGWIERLDAYKAKGNAYQISERFFNIWFLMRRSSRRQKKELYCLSKFLETFYGDDLHIMAKNSLKLESKSLNHIVYNLAMAEVLKDKDLKKQLTDKCYKDLKDEAKENPEVLKQFGLLEGNEIDKEELGYVELEKSFLKKLTENENDVKTWIKLGILYQEDYFEEYEKSKKAFLKAIDLDINNADLWVNLGILYLEDYFGEYEKAEQALLKAIDLNRNHYFAWIVLGNIYCEDFFKEYEKSEKAYLKAIELDENDSLAWARLGTLYQNYLNEYDKALKAYLQMAILDKNDSQAWINLGILYRDDHFKEYGKAEQAFLKAIELNGKDYLPWTALGTIYQSDYFKEYGKAEQAFLKAIELDGKTSAQYFGLGFLYQNDLKDYSKAEEAYLKAIEFDGKDSFSWLSLGVLYQNDLKNYSKAEEAYLKAIELDGKDSISWVSLGILYQNDLKDYNKAEEAYLRAIELDGKDSISWVNLGVLYHNDLKDYNKAEEAYLKAIELDGKDSISWVSLGVLYQNDLKDYNKAEKTYLKAIELDGKDSFSWVSLGGLYRDYFEDYVKAENAYIKGIELVDNDFELWNSLGNLYQDYLQDYDNAEKAYLKAIEIDRMNFYSKFNLVFLYRDKLNKQTTAEQYFNQLEIIPEIEDSYWLNKTLFELYKRNEGIAKEYLEKAFSRLEEGFPSNTQDDWWRFGAVIVKLGYANWFLSVLEHNGFDTILAPYYVAIKALTEKNSEDYLNSKAVEIRDPARKIMKIIEKY
ncbi:tetratricopeptide repeat protein [Flavobacterium branchiicola]|uniref:Tetratricopeptide repeat protein n=1 Tax=Flavobacterium branchiicola TaxID=1114875 RepID=A0ABV9PEJ5_9FLAO|nr:tetratricopeptide repeat protein [Flavobacterium branchiicola]MBS7253982.1 tetratricopeptide repeat protein [Flavobacterium branchiicola]